MNWRSTRPILLAVVLGCDSGTGGLRSQPAGADSPTRLTAASSPDSWTLRFDGIGPLRYGMGVAEVRVALRDTLGPPPPAGECVYMVPAAAPAGVRLMIEGDRMVRVDVDSARIRTVGGGEVGMSEAELRTRYPSLEVRPHKYDTAARYLICREHADSSRRLVFETYRQRVLGYRGGVMPAVEYVEGCS
jgi:hypothetical protein